MADVVLSMALCRPDVTFVLTRDGRTQRELLACAASPDPSVPTPVSVAAASGSSSPTAGPFDDGEARGVRVAQAFPKSELTAITGARAGLAFAAWLSSPAEARTGASALYLVVNGRAVRDGRLARAVATAYGQALESGRYPAGVVYVDMPSHEVDVNAHPQKTEVRFRDARAVFELLATEIARGYGNPTPSLSSIPPSSLSPQAPWASQSRMTTTWTAPRPADPHTPSSPSFDMGSLYAARTSVVPDAVVPDAPSAVARTSVVQAGSSFFANLRPIALVRGELCVCETDDAIYVIDGHAAWERVIFSKLTRGDSASTSVVHGAAATTSVVHGAAASTSVVHGAAASTSVVHGAAASTSVVHGAAASTSVVHVEVAVGDAVERLGESFRARGVWR